MSTAFLVLLVAHALLHLLGFVKAFGLAALPQLTGSISRPMGALWLVAALALLATAASLWAAPRWWWAVGAGALVASQVVIVTSWGDAKFGTLANVVVLVGVVLGYFFTGPSSLRADYEGEVARGLARGLARATPTGLVSEADLAPLPEPLARYLRLVGVVGHPRVWNYRVRFTGRIRGGPDSPWMPMTAEQQSFADQPTRLFYLEATRGGLPVVGLHRYVGAEASMRVKLLAAVPVVSVSGPTLTRAETVTLFNDMCVIAPATLLDAPIAWELVDQRQVKGTFTNAGHTVSATLVFNEEGALADFFSDDRPVLEADGVTLTPSRWSTPLSRYRTFGAFRLAGYGEARYQHPVSGAYAYGEFELHEVGYNVGLE
jgi:hypothetical protein